MSQATMDRRPNFGRRSGNRTIRMMIVDDSVTARAVMMKILAAEEDLDVVEVAGTAEEAIEKLKQVRVDLILLDLEMPGMGGIRAMPQILEQARGAKVLVNSALTDKGAEATLTALSMGAADTLLKPRPGKFNDDYRANLIEKIRVIGSAHRAGALRALRSAGQGRCGPTSLADHRDRRLDRRDPCAHPDAQGAAPGPRRADHGHPAPSDQLHVGIRAPTRARL